ncbi:hypothetical protein [Bifidobacterium cebidarum]|uniref:hypothetical protein n=1 Tax=Bifidobacterium cebidarum TaxID=2650773 RepID=UPI0012656AF9|nr:hypothetical protein [Bifidobacterium cebidarum]
MTTVCYEVSCDFCCGNGLPSVFHRMFHGDVVRFAGGLEWVVLRWLTWKMFDFERLGRGGCGESKEISHSNGSERKHWLKNAQHGFVCELLCAIMFV